jgi:hypothetical protein
VNMRMGIRNSLSLLNLIEKERRILRINRVRKKVNNR